MKSKKEWETKSLEWIHQVREKLDEEIRDQGISPARWVRGRGKINVELLCKRMGLQNYTIVANRTTPPLHKRDRAHGSRG